MGATQLRGYDVRDGSICRVDLNVATSGQAVITRIIEVANSGIKITESTGADSGTGDVKLSIDQTKWAMLDPGTANGQMPYWDNTAKKYIPSSTGKLKYSEAGGVATLTLGEVTVGSVAYPIFADGTTIGAQFYGITSLRSAFSRNDGSLDLTRPDFHGIEGTQGYQTLLGRSTFTTDIILGDGIAANVGNAYIRFPKYGAGLLRTDANGVIGLDTMVYATSSGSGNYIQNQNVGAQVSANMWIDGQVKAQTLTDGYITHALAQINRASAYIELQYNELAGGVRIFGATSTPISFNGNGLESLRTVSAPRFTNNRLSNTDHGLITWATNSTQNWWMGQPSWGANGATDFQMYSASGYVFNINQLTRDINFGGNVSASQIQVNTLKVTTGAGLDKILVSDASGLLSYKDVSTTAILNQNAVAQTGNMYITGSAAFNRFSIGNAQCSQSNVYNGSDIYFDGNGTGIGLYYGSNKLHFYNGVGGADILLLNQIDNTATFSSTVTAPEFYIGSQWLREVVPNNSVRFSGAIEALGNIHSYANSGSSGMTYGATLQSTVATGTAPLTVSSSTLVSNLNANYLGITRVSDTVDLQPTSFLPNTVSAIDGAGIPILLGWMQTALTVKGLDNSLNAWQLISDAHINYSGDELYFRTGMSTWNTARRMWHSGNFTPSNYQTALSGNITSHTHASLKEATMYQTRDLNTLGAAGEFSVIPVLSASTNMFPHGNNHNAVFTISLDSYPEVISTAQLGFNADGDIYSRVYNSTTWNKVYHSGNLTNPITGTGTAGYLPKWLTGGASLGNSKLYDDGTNLTVGDFINLGIGVGPVNKLDIRGNSDTSYGGRNVFGDNGSYNPIFDQYRWSGVSTDYFGTRFITGVGDFRLQVADKTVIGSHTWVNSITAMYNGNVGIGSITPQTTLEVANDGLYQFRIGSGVGTSSFDIGRSYNDGHLHFKANNGVSGFIFDTGNVGVGYASGTEITNNKLAVNGSGYFNGIVSAGGESTGIIKTIGGTRILALESYSADYNYLRSYNAPLVIMSESAVFSYIGGNIVTSLGSGGFGVYGTLSATTAKLTTGATDGYFWKCTSSDGSGAWAAISAGTATGLSAQYIDWNVTSGGSSIANKPTALSQFTNDLGNYGSFVTGTPWTSLGYLTGITSAQVTTALGFTPVTGTPWTSQGYITGITSGMVTTALEFTPYNATNPNGYTSNTGTVTSVALSVPTGLSVTGSPITTSGTFAISLTTGYAIPTTANISTWNGLTSFPGFGTSGTTAAYGNHGHSYYSAGMDGLSAYYVGAAMLYIGNLSTSNYVALYNSGTISGPQILYLPLNKSGQTLACINDIPSTYNLPTASSTVLGGIKIGTGLSIDANGVVTASGGGSVPSTAGIAISTGSAWGTSITDNSANWNTAYTDRNKWDGGSTGLTAATGRTSLGLGSIATKSFWSGTQAAYDALGSYDSNTLYFIPE